jgi:hypothetical protein
LQVQASLTSEATELKDMFGSVVELVGRGVLNGVLPGEDANVVSSPAMTLTSERNDPGLPRFKDIVAKGVRNNVGADVLLPKSAIESASESGPLDSVVMVSTLNPYEYVDDVTSSPLIDIRLYQNGDTLPVNNLTTPLSISFPLLQGLAPGKVGQCRFWDERTQNYSSAGCTSHVKVPINYDAPFYDAATIDLQHAIVLCNCTHLTQFNVAASDFKPSVNTLSLSDFSRVSWSQIIRHPVPALLVLLVSLIFLMLLPGARSRDRRLERNTLLEASADEFFLRKGLVRVVNVAAVTRVSGLRRALSTIWVRLRDKHLHLSIWLRHPFSPFTCVDRLIVVYTAEVGSFAANAIFYGAAANPTLVQGVIVGTIAALIVIPYKIVSRKLFEVSAKRKQRAKREKLEAILKEEKRKAKEREEFFFASEESDDGFVVGSKKSVKNRLYEFIGFLFSLLFLLTSVMLIILYGLQFDLAEDYVDDDGVFQTEAFTSGSGASYKWLFACGVSLIQSIFVTNPLMNMAKPFIYKCLGRKTKAELLRKKLQKHYDVFDDDGNIVDRSNADAKKIVPAPTLEEGLKPHISTNRKLFGEKMHGLNVVGLLRETRFRRGLVPAWPIEADGRPVEWNKREFMRGARVRRLPFMRVATATICDLDDADETQVLGDLHARGVLKLSLVDSLTLKGRRGASLVAATDLEADSPSTALGVVKKKAFSTRHNHAMHRYHRLGASAPRNAPVHLQAFGEGISTKVKYAAAKVEQMFNADADKADQAAATARETAKIRQSRQQSLKTPKLMLTPRLGGEKRVDGETADDSPLGGEQPSPRFGEGTPRRSPSLFKRLLSRKPSSDVNVDEIGGEKIDVNKSGTATPSPNRTPTQFVRRLFSRTNSSASANNSVAPAPLLSAVEIRARARARWKMVRKVASKSHERKKQHELAAAGSQRAEVGIEVVLIASSMMTGAPLPARIVRHNVMRTFSALKSFDKLLTAAIIAASALDADQRYGGGDVAAAGAGSAPSTSTTAPSSAPRALAQAAVPSTLSLSSPAPSHVRVHVQGATAAVGAAQNQNGVAGAASGSITATASTPRAPSRVTADVFVSDAPVTVEEGALMWPTAASPPKSLSHSLQQLTTFDTLSDMGLTPPADTGTGNRNRTLSPIASAALSASAAAAPQAVVPTMMQSGSFPASRPSMLQQLQSAPIAQTSSPAAYRQTSTPQAPEEMSLFNALAMSPTRKSVSFAPLSGMGMTVTGKGASATGRGSGSGNGGASASNASASALLVEESTGRGGPRLLMRPPVRARVSGVRRMSAKKDGNGGASDALRRVSGDNNGVRLSTLLSTGDDGGDGGGAPIVSRKAPSTLPLMPSPAHYHDDATTPFVHSTRDRQALDSLIGLDADADVDGGGGGGDASDASATPAAAPIAYPNRAVALAAAAARRPATSHGSSHPYAQAQRQRAPLTLSALPTPVVPQVPRPRNPDFTDDMDVVWAEAQPVAPSLRPPSLRLPAVPASFFAQRSESLGRSSQSSTPATASNIKASASVSVGKVKVDGWLPQKPAQRGGN